MQPPEKVAGAALYASVPVAAKVGWPLASTAVDDTDHHVFAFDQRTAGKLRPQAARRRQAEKGAGRDGVIFAGGIGLDVDDGRVVFQRQHFGVGQHRGKAVDDDFVIGQDRRVGDRGQHFAFFHAQILDIVGNRRGMVIECDARRGPGGGQAGDVTLVGGGRFGLQLDDVGAANFLCMGQVDGAGQQDGGGKRDGANLESHVVVSMVL